MLLFLGRLKTFSCNLLIEVLLLMVLALFDNFRETLFSVRCYKSGSREGSSVLKFEVITPTPPNVLDA